ncbi:hypothetical protein [Hamadaea tsunoensis]|uniref:hypothetical protein n=1 Tax=Hamadaea tsunoensis TaxID=53368 RepID=UPI000486DB14|nr:hypothetical protein [Hamadaea tsunoensis]
MQPFGFDPWSWRDPTLLAGGYTETTPDAAPSPRAEGVEGGPGTDLDLTGYKVAATDGDVGHVKEQGEGFLVVDTGPWIFGRIVVVPAGIVDRVDHQEKTVFVDRTRDHVKHAPEFDPIDRDTLASYYASTYGM